MATTVALGVRATLRRMAPEPIKSIYRRLREGVQSAMRPTQMTCRVRSHAVVLGVSSPSEEMRARTYETKEPETLDWIDENLRVGDVLFDIGANIGLYSLYAARACAGAIVYAFEPESQNFARLCRNVVLNQVSNLLPCNFPLADCSKFDVFHVHTLEAGDSLHSFGKASEFRAAGERAALRQGALSTSLDALVHQHGVPQPALIKLDVDGIEGPILSGASQILAAPSFRSLLVEWNFRDEREIADVECTLRNSGLRLAKSGARTAELYGLKSRNLIFTRISP